MGEKELCDCGLEVTPVNIYETGKAYCEICGKLIYDEYNKIGDGSEKTNEVSSTSFKSTSFPLPLNSEEDNKNE